MEFSHPNYRLIDQGIITLEWTTALFSIVVFLIVVFFLHRWLLKPIIDNKLKLEKRQKNLKKNNIDKEHQINALQQDINDKKSAFWRDVKIKQLQIIKDTNISTSNEVQKMQLQFYKKLEEEKNITEKELSLAMEALQNKIPLFKDKLINKLK